MAREGFPHKFFLTRRTRDGDEFFEQVEWIHVFLGSRVKLKVQSELLQLLGSIAVQFLLCPANRGEIGEDLV